MALMDAVARALTKAFSIFPANPGLQVEYASAMNGLMGLSIDDLWRTQPHLRTVVDFLARNTAQLGLQTFQRVSETDRQRLRTDPVAQLLSRPNPQMTGYELVYGLVGDVALYNEAFWNLAPSATTVSGWSIQPIPPSWVVRRGGSSAFTVDWVDFRNPTSGAVVRMTMDQLIWFKGWNPGFPRHASSPVEALKDILAEQLEARIFRRQMWRRGGRFGGVITRPQGARWEPKGREKFKRMWQAQYASMEGSNAGATPILEDGMTYNPVTFSSKEQDWAEGTKLSLAQVASVYQVNPTMVGLLDNANFSNVEAFRKMLYSDTLGPLLAMIEDRINTFLVPRVTTAQAVYTEFNIAEKLQGSFEEQAAALQSSVGRPWMTANEARARMNMPALAGDADQLVTPLNVLAGGQASPRDSGTQNVNAGEIDAVVVRPERKAIGQKSVKLTAGAPDAAVTNAQDVLSAFFKRQRGVVLSRLGSKAADEWWDEDRWNRELGDDLFKLSTSVATQLGRKQAEALGFDPDDYDEDRTLAFLKAVATKRAEWINATTKAQIDDALEQDEPDVGGVFDNAVSARTGTASKALMAAVAGFAVVEAAKQLVGTSAQKTWETGPNARADHAAMDGETVALDETFSNGAHWPGDPVLGAEGVANCNCGVSVTF
jgi:HK97 family phage portal protein